MLDLEYFDERKKQLQREFDGNLNSIRQYENSIKGLHERQAEIRGAYKECEETIAKINLPTDIESMDGELEQKEEAHEVGEL